jgi:hypothetical protein
MPKDMHALCLPRSWLLEAVVIFHRVPNMSRDMFIKKKIPVDGFLENEPVSGRVKLTLDGF